MHHGCRPFLFFAALALLLVGAPPAGGDVGQGQDVPFYETPPAVVAAMFELAPVSDGDVVYDLGSGDGRIVIEAARRGARGVGVEIDTELVALARERAEHAGVAERVRFVEGDLFEVAFDDATVVMLYLTRRVNRRLRPVLARRLPPGTPVVSHRFAIEGWDPVERVKVEGRPVFLYRVPERAWD